MLKRLDNEFTAGFIEIEGDIRRENLASTNFIRFIDAFGRSICSSPFLKEKHQICHSILFLSS